MTSVHATFEKRQYESTPLWMWSRKHDACSEQAKTVLVTTE